MEQTVLPDSTTEQSTTDVESTAYNRLLPILVQCFTIILLGYMSGRLGIMSKKEAEGLGLFIRYFSLPSLICGSLVKIEFTNVNWMFLACIFIGKLLVFAIVAILTMIFTRPTNIGKAGLYGIFATQSNDFALGYPLLVSSHYPPQYTDFLYLIAPIQLITLNPIGYVLMEKQRQKDEHHLTSKIGLWLSLVSNPIVIVTILGTVGNVIFHHQLPLVIGQLLEVLGTAFPACALFLLGHTISGKCSHLRGNSLIVPALLIAAKILLLPIIIFELVNRIVPGHGHTSQGINDLSSFGFLYGTFPTAPSVFIFATQFDMPTTVVAPAMVACTVLSAPLMFVTASMTMLPTSNLSQFRYDLLRMLTCVSVISLLCSIWVLILFAFGKKWKFVVHKMTLFLIVSQIMTSLGGILWTIINTEHQWIFFVQYILSVGGIFSARIWTALLAVSMALLQWRNLCYISHVYKYIIYIGLGNVLIVVAVLAFRRGSFIPNQNNTDPNFPFGESQLLAAFIVILLTLIVTLLALFAYYHKSQDTNEECPEAKAQLISSKNEQNETVIPNSTNAVEILGDDAVNTSSKEDNYSRGIHSVINCPSDFYHSEQENEYNSSYYPDIYTSCFDGRGIEAQQKVIANEIVKCVILLLLLSVSMAVGLTICLWKLFLEETTGIYVELEFLDVILNYGQGIFPFFVFGLDSELVMALSVRFCQQFGRYSGKFSQNANKASAVTDQVCRQFVVYHKDKCIEDLCSDRQVGDHSYESTFRGKELVDWLLAVGLASDRNESQKYGCHLMLGGVISHVNGKHLFYDNMSLYRFC